jgi:hypothetical protein
MRTTIAIISALAATAAAGTAYTTVDVTITSCPPEGKRHVKKEKGKTLNLELTIP